MQPNQNVSPSELTNAVYLFNQKGNPVDVNAISATSAVFANIKDYGAKGDNKANDTTAIQSAIDAAPAGATIYFPAGTYLINKTLQLKNSQTYLGCNYSYSSSVIKQANNANLIAMMAVTEYMANGSYSSDPILVSNLYFEGNSGANTNSPANGGHGIIFMSSDSIIENCWFHMIPQSAIVFSDCNISGTPIVNSSIENHIINCKVDTAGQHGIWVQDHNTGICTDGYIRDCIVSSTNDICILLDRGAGWFLSGNHVYGGQRSGIIVNNAWATSIIGNEIDGYAYEQSPNLNYYTGISVTCIGPRPTVVEGNIIASPETNPNTVYQHLSINGNASTDARCIVTGNTIFGGYANTTSSTVVNQTGTQTIIIGNTTNINIGQSLTIDAAGANREIVTVMNITQGGAPTANTLTAKFTKTHSGTYVITSSTSPYNSVGITIQTFGTQQASGQPFNVQVALNQVNGVGKEFYYDSAPTTVLEQSHVFGDLQCNGNIKAGLHLLSNSPNATASVGISNGTSAPLPLLIGNDVRGVINFGCGSGATAGLQVNIQYNTPYTYYPTVVISPANAVTASTANIWYVSNVSNTGFSIASTIAPSTSTKPINTYSFTFHVVG